MNDGYTQTQALPLPHPSNRLQDDVLRLRDALLKTDGLLADLQIKLGTKASAADLDALDVGFSDALGSLQTAVNGLSTGRVRSVNGVAGVDITLKPENLALGPANGATSSTIAYETGTDRVGSVTDQIDGAAATTTYSYDGAGRISKVQRLYHGRLRTVQYTYDANGRNTGYTATETTP